MKSKIIVSLILIITTICSFQYSFAEEKTVNSNSFYKDTQIGILAYKEVNAFQVTLADGSKLLDSGLNTDSTLSIDDVLKRLEIVFIIDTSGSMAESNKEQITRNSSKILVESLFDKVGKEKLKIGVIYFNSGIDKNKILTLTNDENAILNHLDKIYSSGNTRMSDSLVAARNMLLSDGENTPADDEGVIKMVCTLSDGELQDEEQAVQEFNNIHQANLSTTSIFVATPITDRFIQMQNNTSKHKNFWTGVDNLEKTIVNDIYNDIYMKIIMASNPKSTFNVTDNVGIIPGNEIIFQVDGEIMHGATIKIEYIISITTAFDCSNIIINDVYEKPLIFSENEKLLTENKTNSDYGWKLENGNLIIDTGNLVQNAANEYRVKLVLSIVQTPTMFDSMNRMKNYMTFSLKNLENNQIIDVQYKDENGNRIKAMDFLIIPPTGSKNLMQKVVLVLSYTVAITSCILIVICIKDYINKNKI